MNWGKGIVIVMALFMTFILYMVVQMFGTNVDLVEEDYYQQEVNYEQRRTALKNSLEFKNEISLERIGNALFVVFPEELNMENAKGTMHLYHVKEASKDLKLPLVSKYGNRQPFLLTEAHAGRHTLKISFEIEGKMYYFEQSVTV